MVSSLTNQNLGYRGHSLWQHKHKLKYTSKNNSSFTYTTNWQQEKMVDHSGGSVRTRSFVYCWFASKDGDKTGTATTTSTTSVRTGTTPISTMSNSVTVSSIKGLGVSPLQDAGTEVSVSVEEVSAPAWVVVYESNNGKPGNVLGAGYMTQQSSPIKCHCCAVQCPDRPTLLGKRPTMATVCTLCKRMQRFVIHKGT